MTKHPNKKIIFHAIGIIRTPFKTPSDLRVPPFHPDAPYNDQNITGTVDIFPPYREGIADILPGSSGILLFYFDRSPGYQLTTRSHFTRKEVGVFSTRSPHRPNGIGVTVVKFLQNNGHRLVFQGVDMLDETPLLDIKPMAPPVGDQK